MTQQTTRRQKYVQRCAVKAANFLDETLAKDFSAVFGEPEKPKPLAIDIKKQIQDRYQQQISSTSLNQLLNKWVNRIPYKKAVLEFNFRYNLDGSKSEVIDSKAKELAALDLRTMNKAIARKKEVKKPKKKPAKRNRKPDEPTRNLT